MRKVLLTATAMTLASGSVMASSIEIIRGDRTSNNSIITISCQACPPLTAKADKSDDTPNLAPGTQEISVRIVDGKKQVVRTEAWLGGSPVTYISNNPTWLPQEDAGTTLAEDKNEIDTASTTSAVDDVSQNAPTPAATVEAAAATPLEGVALRSSQ